MNFIRGCLISEILDRAYYTGGIGRIFTGDFAFGQKVHKNRLDSSAFSAKFE